MQVNSSTQYPICTPESPGLMSTTGLESTMSMGGTLPGKEDPPYHVGKVEASGDSLSSPLSYMPYHIVGMAGTAE